MKESKAGATSSHTIKAKGGCLQHNRRTFNAPNVIPDKTHLNQSWESEEIKNIKTIRTLERRAEKLYTEKVGQKCQKSFAPYRESVVVIREKSTMEQAKDFKTRVEAAIPGIKCVGIWMHKDEGYWRSQYIEGNNDFKCNYHVHYLWCCQNPTTGKAIPIKRADMRKMQDLAAAAFKMERGNLAKETRKQWKNGWEYKTKAEEKRIQKLRAAGDDEEQRLGNMKAEQQTVAETTKKARQEKMQIEEAIVKGKGDKARLEKDNKQLQNVNDELQTANKELQTRKEQNSKDLASLEAKGEEIKSANRTEEVKLKKTRLQIKEEMDKGLRKYREREVQLEATLAEFEKEEKPPKYNHKTFECDNLIPSIPIPPTFGKEEWAKKQQGVVNRQCNLIADKARTGLVSIIDKQEEYMEKQHKALIAAKQKAYLVEKRSEPIALVEEAVKAIIDFFEKRASKQDAKDVIKKAYIGFLKDFFGDNELGRSLIREANLRIENGVRKKSNNHELLKCCLTLLKEMAVFVQDLLRRAINPEEDREEDIKSQFSR